MMIIGPRQKSCDGWWVLFWASFDGWLLMDVLILIFPTPTGREMNMTQWRLDMGPPWVRGALEAHFGALVDGLTIIGGEDFAHICTHTDKSVSISEMLESAATDHRTPLQSRILLSNQSGKQVKHQQLLSTNVLIAHFPSSTSSQYQNSYLDLAV